MKNSKGKITVADVQRAAMTLYHVDEAAFDHNKMLQKYQKLEENLKMLAGQQEAKDSLLSAARQVLSGVQDKTKPRYRLFFVGPKGTGKTEIIKLFADAMNLPTDNRILMSEYAT